MHPHGRGGRGLVFVPVIDLVEDFKRGSDVNCHAALSPEMALRIEKAFGVNMDMLLRMQAWFDTYTMRQRAGDIDVKPFNPPGPR